MRCRKVIAARLTEFQKLGGHLRANHVQTRVRPSRVATTITIEARHGVGSAGFKFGAENVFASHVYFVVKRRGAMNRIGIPMYRSESTVHAGFNRIRYDENQASDVWWD